MDILTDIVFAAADEAHETGVIEAALAKDADATLFGEGGIDSMALVQFIVIVEEKIEDTLDLELRLATDKAMSRRTSPFATMGALAAFIDELVKEAKGG